MENQNHMPTGPEALEYCQNQLPRFKWRICKDDPLQVYLEGVFEGKLLYLIVGLGIERYGAIARILIGDRPIVRSELARSTNEKGIPYQRALAEVTDGLIDLVRDAHDLGLDNVIDTAGPLA